MPVDSGERRFPRATSWLEFRETPLNHTCITQNLRS
jgi:hypothetical protein